MYGRKRVLSYLSQDLDGNDFHTLLLGQYAFGLYTSYYADM